MSFDVDSPLPDIAKHPTAHLDYALNWGSWLDRVGDSIASATWSFALEGIGSVIDVLPVDAGHSFTGGIATVWIDGGTLGSTYRVSCSIVTTGGRVDTRSFILRIISR